MTLQKILKGGALALLVLAAPAVSRADADVTAQRRGGLPYTKTASSASGTAHVYSTDNRTGSAEAWATHGIGVKSASVGKETGLANGWAASASSFNPISTLGLAPGERLDAALLVTGTVSVSAYSGSNSSSLGQAYARYTARTQNSIASYEEALQIRGGFISPLSEISENIRIRFTPKVTVSGQTEPLPLTEDDLVGVGFSFEEAFEFDSFTAANSFSQAQANALIAVFRTVGAPSLGLGPFTARVSWDYDIEMEKTFILPLTLGRSDYLSLFSYTDVIGNSGSGGEATIALGNNVEGGGGLGSPNIRVFVPDDTTRDLTGLSVKIGPGLKIPVERYSDVFAVAPEPAAWAMMILGFGMAGAMIRRRSAWLRVI